MLMLITVATYPRVRCLLCLCVVLFAFTLHNSCPTQVLVEKKKETSNSESRMIVHIVQRGGETRSLPNSRINQGVLLDKHLVNKE